MRRYINVELTPQECRSFVLERLKELVIESLGDDLSELERGEVSRAGSLEDDIEASVAVKSFTELLKVIRRAGWHKEAAFRMVLQAIGEEQEELNEAWKVLVDEWDT